MVIIRVKEGRKVESPYAESARVRKLCNFLACSKGKRSRRRDLQCGGDPAHPNLACRPPERCIGANIFNGKRRY